MRHSEARTDSPRTHHPFAVPSKPLLLDSSPDNLDTNSILFAPNLLYEPTSVLDPRLTSRFVTAPSAAPAGVCDPPRLFRGGDSHHHFPSLDEWYTASWLLPETPDFSPFPDDVNPSFLNSHFDIPFDSLAAGDLVSSPFPTFDRSQLESLIRAAYCLESNDFDAARVILSRLNQHLTSTVVSPLQRSVSLFKDALLGLLCPSTAEPPIPAVELVRHIDDHKAFSDLSPVPHFATFTATQILIETLDGGARSIHLVDFDFGLGVRWSSFAQELAGRSGASLSSPPAVRITAVVAEESAETALAAENLRDFACNLKISLVVNFVRLGGLGKLALNSVVLSGAGEPTAVVLTPSAFRLFGSGDGAQVSTAMLLRFVRRASPRVVVFIDTDGGATSGVAGAQPTQSLQRMVSEGVGHYATLLESVVEAAAATGAGEGAVRQVERAVVRPWVAAAVGEWPVLLRPWREVLAGAGWVPLHVSELAELQARWLVQRAPVDGHHVARRNGTLVLNWKGRELASTSAWRC
ncbi:hypothetical protein OPV22_018272 [Ensete ventricosum]|uniref:Scarecrow-like protein 15 n=1 Tax=Ensete ventricosum TaxID=4639 RepID=A0AAV8R2X9_ENSVE|nr:hypothetical protein OPV22_018272 [Ensete ventricosum]RWW86760.1 hypothetical protein BHE74_00004450 [Ensete ventricosum]